MLEFLFFSIWQKVKKTQNIFTHFINLFRKIICLKFVPFRDHLEAAAVDSTNLTTEQRDYVQRRLANEVLAELPAQVFIRNENRQNIY